MSDNPTEGFTLYLRGADENGLRQALRPLGVPGDDGKFRLEDHDVWVTLSPKVALIRIPYAMEEGEVRPLVAKVLELAKKAGLVLSDDVTSTRTLDDLMRNLRIERERVGKMNPPIQLGKWPVEKTIAWGIAALALIALAWWAWNQVTAAAHIPGS